MTLVLEATPSSGGPRCLRSRGSRGSRALVSLVASAAGVVAAAASVSFLFLVFLFVLSTMGSTWAGTFVGVPLVASVAVPFSWRIC
jgi:predicted histidine transporter YuiF (NhaC family)